MMVQPQSTPPTKIQQAVFCGPFAGGITATRKPQSNSNPETARNLGIELLANATRPELAMPAQPTSEQL